MYLKSIEVHGFKSFANKIIFQFHNGITAIVGPNGSGKSNVADAVRWVLGEQRIKQLRGASMQDVIFSGTETRKPVGYAYVAITLDNADHQLPIEYNEVTIARRIYRSGESEYLINGTPCRLKDVNELFYDTGIGKEGYSIIGQGQIDKILSGKPEERRELFDEAAGIVKFKRRKQTAQKKLEDEKLNLVRVSDILSEIEKQIKPLEKQAEVAKVYLKKKEELKNLDVNVFLLENEKTRTQLTSIEEKQQIASSDLEESTAKYEAIKVEYEEIQNELVLLEESIEKERAALNDTGLLRGKLEGEINVLREQINSSKGSENHLITRLDTVRGEIDSREKEKEKILNDKNAIDGELEEAEKIRDEAKENLFHVQKSIEEFNTEIEKAKNLIINALNERATIKSKMGRYDTMLEQSTIQKAQLNARLLRVKSDESELEDALKKFREEFEQASNLITQLNQKLKSAENRLEEIHTLLTSKDNQLRDRQVVYHQDKSKLDSIVNMSERYDGYGNSIRKVMEQKEENPKISGVVADIIKVEKKYEIAIETALGGNIQNIVTEDEETAKKMITFLKQNKHGRATFLPLTSITNPQKFKTPEVLEEKGVIGMADDLVHTESKYSQVAKAMLGRIVVVDHVENAMKIARKYEYGIRMVTLEGELLVPGGAISGGAFKNSSNLLGRKREQEELEKKVQDHLQTIDSILLEIETLKEERNLLRKELEEIKRDVQAKFIEQNTARLNVMQAQERKEEAVSGFDQLKNEEKEIEISIVELTENKKNILAELEASEILEKESDKIITGFQGMLEEKRVEETTQTAKTNELDVEVEKKLQKQEFQQQNINRIQGELFRLNGELEEIIEKRSSLLNEIARKEENILSIQNTIQESHTYQGAAQQHLTDSITRKETLTNRQKTFFADRESISERMNALDKEVYRLNTQRDKLEENLETQINYMWDEYEITLSEALGMQKQDMPEFSVMKKEISALKDQIRKLGDVNVNAIEDYKNLTERHLFLKTQHDDLVLAEQTLLKIIDELDSAMRKQFQEKFGQISKEFDKVFKELFGGGKGTLELMEDEDILEAGIRIIAQPPGKKLQNMMQLSGGEKALTAIALLFAIQNLKPSPFCLLDEIEAALDESNVGRYAKYLHKLSVNTQFIVITHRRGTMEAADRLYGITMREKGVSALVSVNLIDKDLDE